MQGCLERSWIPLFAFSESKRKMMRLEKDKVKEGKGGKAKRRSKGESHEE